jgi:5-aminolevulinate synthase
LADHKYRDAFHKNVQLLRSRLDAFGVKYSPNPSHITPIHIGNAAGCKKIADQLLLEYGLYLQPVNYPTVKVGAECLRITVTSRHTAADIEYLAKSLQKVLEKENIDASNKTTSQLSKAR